MPSADEAGLSQDEVHIVTERCPSGAIAAATLLLMALPLKIGRMLHFVLVACPSDEPVLTGLSYSAVALASQVVLFLGIRRRWNWARRVYLAELGTLILAAACGLAVTFISRLTDLFPPSFVRMPVAKILLQGVFWALDFVWYLPQSPWLIYRTSNPTPGSVSTAVIDIILIGLAVPVWMGLRSPLARAYFSGRSAPRGMTWTRRTRVVKELAIFVTVICALGILLYVVFPPCSIVQSVQTQCGNNVRQLGLACLLYAADWDNHTPSTLLPLRPYVNNEGPVFVCPADPRLREKVASIRDDPTRVDELSTYFTTRSVSLRRLQDASHAILIAERGGPHGTKAPGHNVCFADGHVEFLTPERFDKALIRSMELLREARQDETLESSP